MSRRAEIARPELSRRFQTLDQTKHNYAIYPRARGVDRRIVTRPSRGAVSSVITTTGTGDHLRLDQPITFAGMRMEETGFKKAAGTALA